MLSKSAQETLQKISEGKRPCAGINPQIVDKLRREGMIKILIKRGDVPERFCAITADGEKYLAQEVTP